MPVYPSKHFPESKVAHKYLDNLRGIEIGGGAHNGWGLNILNVDYCDPPNGNGSDDVVGEFLPVHVVAPGDNLPFKDKTFDFVINSHVLEHFFDPIGTMKEWTRVATQYIVMIMPHKDRCNDRDRPVTTIRELWDRHTGKTKQSSVGGPDVDDHHNVWTTQAFQQLCNFLNYDVVECLDVDDKVGNGFMVVIKL